MLHLFAINKSVRKYRKYKTDPTDGRSREHLTDEKNKKINQKQKRRIQNRGNEKGNKIKLGVEILETKILSKI